MTGAPPAPRPALETRGLGRTFRVGLLRRPHVALAGVDLCIERGRTVGFVGPNGSGKSTLLRIFAGVDRPTAGSVHLLGHAPWAREARRRVAYLPDGDPFPAELTARGALGLVARLRGLGGRAARDEAARALGRVGLADRGATRLGAFSRGMHRRFGLAQAFLGAPDVVLLDEPTAGLDAPGFGALAELLGEARRRGTTVVLASHVPSDLVEHCDEAVLLVGGHVRARADARELLGERDLVELTLRGDGSAGERARGVLEAAGFEVTAAAPARRSLAELYRDVEEPRRG